MRANLEHISFEVPIKKEFQLEVAGFQYKKEDQNKTILVLPGLDDSVSYYQSMLNLLIDHNPGWNLLALDLRGQGQTLHNERNISQMKIKIEEQTAIVKNILEQESITECFVIGLSYAGAVSLQLALENPDTIKGIGLIAPYVSNFKAFKRGLTGIYYTILDKHPAKGLFAMMGLPLYFNIAKYEHRLNINKTWTQKEVKALTKLTLGVLEYNTEQALDNLHEMPLGVHLLCGFDDKVIPISAHKKFYHHIPTHLNKTFSLEEGVGHRIFERHPDVAAEWVHRVLNVS